MRNGPTGSTSPAASASGAAASLTLSTVQPAMWHCARMSEWMPGGGTLRTYLGIAPGVGKTYEMLRDARARRRAGVDAVVAYRERHGRAATAAQLGDLEVLPTRTVSYRGTSFAELDVTAVLDRSPELALVDELAHANLPARRQR